MIFRQFLARSIFSGDKTETRRLVKPGDEAFIILRQIAAVRRNGKFLWKVNDGSIDWVGKGSYGSNAPTHSASYRQPTYSIHTGRGKKGIGRFRIPYIRAERVQDITDDGAIKEGMQHRIFDPEAPFMPFDMAYSPMLLAFVAEHDLGPDGKLSGRDITFIPAGPRAAFACLWDTIHPKGKRWIDNPEVWVLGIAPVEGVA